MRDDNNKTPKKDTTPIKSKSGKTPVKNSQQNDTNGSDTIDKDKRSVKNNDDGEDIIRRKSRKSVINDDEEDEEL